jgi:hypothetical protein
MFRMLLMGTSAVFALWVSLDFFFHGLLLGEYYKQTAPLWRPKGEEKMVLNLAVTLVSSFMFTLIYTTLVRPKGSWTGLVYGAMFGTSAGAAMGYGSYAFMPVPHVMALVWTLTGIVQGIASGAAVGMLIKDDPGPTGITR